MSGYFFGHSEIELRRLVAQATALRPITERLLRAAGLRAGMRVLDLGCGAGDVSMLTSELMGPEGSVVGIDRAAAAIALATDRAARAGLRNIRFEVATETETDFADRVPFDFVIGRYVVLHQPDPARFIREAAARLRPGGVIAFHEIDMRRRFESLPAVAAFDSIAAEVMQAIRAGVPHPDAAGRLVALFAEAGLATPSVFCERPAGGAAMATTIIRWVAATLAGVRSLTKPSSGPVDVELLEAELAAGIGALRSQILGPEQCCAWAAV